MEFFDDRKSRSQKKRESTALQMKGEELAALGPAALAALDLPPDLRAAVTEWRGMKSHEAKRRQMQYIGRLMRELDDPEGLLAALTALQFPARQEAARLNRLEEARKELLAEDENARRAALARILGQWPALDEARLRHMVEAALAERTKNRPPKVYRELFRYLRQADEAGES